MRFLYFPRITTAILMLITTSCTYKNNNVIVPAVVLYDNGINNLKNGQYQDAAEEFSNIYIQYPAHPINAEAKLMQAYSLYLAEEYDDAIDIIDLYHLLYPRHKDILYSHYLYALSFYAQINNNNLDQTKTYIAQKQLKWIIENYPNSKYSKSARLKLELTNDRIAGHNMIIGRYYLKKNNPIAAIARFQIIANDNNKPIYRPEALYRLIESTKMLGLIDEAKIYYNVLKHEYPDAIWTSYGKDLLK